MKDLKCPFCYSDLKVTHQEHYQDLSEHVCNPNGRPSLKDGYDCLNQECLAFGTFSWIEDGEYYIKRPAELDYKDWDTIQRIVCPSGNYNAVGSWNHYYQMGKDAIESKSFTINLKYYKFDFIPLEKGWDYPEEIRHMPDLKRWKVQIWKRGENGCYTNVIPFWKMTAYSIRSFNRAYSEWLEDGNERSLKSAYCTAFSLNEWGMNPDDRFYSRLSSFLIKLFKPSKVGKISKSFQE